jgi:hypothetical protein
MPERTRLVDRRTRSLDWIVLGIPLLEDRSMERV